MREQRETTGWDEREQEGRSSVPMPAPVFPARWTDALAGSFHRRRDIREFSIDGEALLFDPRSQSLHHLNETALTVWRSCDERSIAQLAAVLTETYDLAFDSAMRHVRNVVDYLSLAGLFAEER